MVCSMLENLGLEIWQTENVESVISLALTRTPHLLIVDVDHVLPDGIAVLAGLRDQKPLDTAKVIALASGHHEMQHPLLTRSRIDRVLIKPLRRAKLRTAVVELLPSLGVH